MLNEEKSVQINMVIFTILVLLTGCHAKIEAVKNLENAEAACKNHDGLKFFNLNYQVQCKDGLNIYGSSF